MNVSEVMKVWVGSFVEVEAGTFEKLPIEEILTIRTDLKY